MHYCNNRRGDLDFSGRNDIKRCLNINSVLPSWQREKKKSRNGYHKTPLYQQTAYFNFPTFQIFQKYTGYVSERITFLLSIIFIYFPRQSLLKCSRISLALLALVKFTTGTSNRSVRENFFSRTKVLNWFKRKPNNLL